MLVACDIGSQKEQNVVFGSVWVSIGNGSLREFNAECLDLRVKYNCWGTLKWKSSKRQVNILDMCLEFVDLFFKHNVRFSALIVDKNVYKSLATPYMGTPFSNAIPNFSKVHLTRRVKHFCDNNCRLTILLHRGEHTNRVSEVKNSLSNYINILLPNTGVTIKHVQEIPAENLSIIQLCDILTGAISHSYNNNYTNDENKEIVKKIEKNLGRTLSTKTSYDEQKFNIWPWAPNPIYKIVP